jgi:hypothetical protein
MLPLLDRNNTEQAGGRKRGRRGRQGTSMVDVDDNQGNIQFYAVYQIDG